MRKLSLFFGFHSLHGGVNSHPLISRVQTSSRPGTGAGAWLKIIFDVAAAVLALVFLAPLIAMLALILLVAQGRPIFIRHTRVGFQGKSFPCFKFRSMRADGDEVLRQHLRRNEAAKLEWEATRKLKDDPRVTPLGHVMRKSSVDEIPQLLNVIRGEMSLVGPRPIVRGEVVHYGSQFTEYTRMRPGITGLWQVSGRSDVSYKARVQLDVQYVNEWSFAKDVMIICKTVPAVLRSKGSY